MGKAGDCLSLLYVLHNICIEFDDGSRRDAHRLAAFESICMIFTTCSEHVFFIPRPKAEEMLQSCETFQLHYNWLTRNAEANLCLRYNPVCKLHHLWQICLHTKYLNPKMGWCFQFEDFVGTMIRMAKGCMHGTPLSLVGRKCLENYLLRIQICLRE